MKTKKTKIFAVFFFALFIFIAFIIFNYSNIRCSKIDYSICNANINNLKLKLRVAYSQKAQAKGLMFVDNLKHGEGMIFVYDEAKILSFWMKNTLIPLSIAYINQQGIIMEIYDMPVTETSDENNIPVYTSTYPAMYAVEVPLGWFAMYGVQAGDKIKISGIIQE